MPPVTVRGMTAWIESGVLAWTDQRRYEDESVLVYFKGVGLADLTEGLVARHRPPFAQGGEVAPGEWGVIVHHLHEPSREDFDPIDHRELCPAGAPHHGRRAGPRGPLLRGASDALDQ